MTEHQLPAENTQNIACSFRVPKSLEWLPLDLPSDAEQDDFAKSKVQKAKDSLEQMLLASLKMEQVIVLAGSGCSLDVIGSNGLKGPSMGDLWKVVVDDNRDTAMVIAKEVHYDLDKRDIEGFLSQINSWKSVKSNPEIDEFLKMSNKIILSRCSEFVEGANLTAHETFLHRLSRRRARDQRLKLFTTNYDLCFESAAGKIGCIPIDGFSFTNPRFYDPRFFDYDIVRRSRSGVKQDTYLEGVFQLYKLHGSVNWECENNQIREVLQPDPNKACLIYPASGKYQQSYSQPYLESVSQYLSAIREPNTCVVVVGFGFNDDHLSEPLFSAVRSNPHMRLIIVDPTLQEKAKDKSLLNKFQKQFLDKSFQGEDIWFINAKFEVFSNLIPDLKSLTPAERLFHSIQGIHKSND